MLCEMLVHGQQALSQEVVYPVAGTFESNPWWTRWANA